MHPLASVQQVIWFDQMLHHDMPCYNIGTILHLDGELDPALLEAAIHEVAHAHDGLRLRLHRDADLAVQQVMPRIDFELPCHDFSAHADAEARSEQHLRAVFGTPFALHGARLWASQLVRIGPTRHHWLFYGHHVILDGFSCTHVVALVLASYRRRVRGDVSASPAGTSYREFLADDRAYLDSPRYKRDAQFWNERFSRMPAPLLIADPARRGAQAVRVPSVPWEIDRGLYARLETFAAAAGGSVPHCLLALIAVLFSRTHATDEVVIGVPVHNRTARDRLTLGMFSSVIPVRIAVDPDRPFALLIRDVAAELRSCYRHQRYPVADLNRTLNLARHGRPQLFDITLAMASFSGLVEQSTPAWTALYLHNGFEQTPLALRLCDYNPGEPVTLEFNHNVAFLDRAAVEVIRRRFEHLLHAVLADGGAQPAGALALLDPAEREQVLVHWNHTVPARSAGLCIHQRFEAQVRRTPQATALVHGARTLSYHALNTRANLLARQLRAQGVGPDRLVALCLERSPALVVAILAVLKAGGAYVPLDPAHASARLGAILDDSQPAMLLLDHTGRSAVGEMADRFTVIDVQADDADDGLDDADDLPPGGLDPHHLAYVIYTSGSTGQPKGVMVEHAQVARLFDATRDRFRFDSQDVWSLFHSVAFDFSVWEIWGALLHGGRLVVVPTAIARAPDAFYELLCEQGVTVLNQTPSAFRQLAAARTQSTRAHRLRCVVFGGEALEPHTLKPWFARNDPAATQLFNMYGITETTVHVTCHALQAGDADRAGFSPIGVRLPHLRIYILDARMQPVPIGVQGELYIGGGGVARGYLNRPQLTAERFLDDPFVPGARLYRSGDLGRWLSDGSIEYLGRNDQQVKIRGFRIEPGEIEARLAQVPGVREVVVLAREDAPGDVRLVAYYTGADTLQADALRQHAAQGLPPYMVPAAYVALAALPLTPNGKLDRKALPAPEDQAFARSAYEAPQGPDEQALATLWAELLGIDRVGRHDNFFELGGHSLLAVRMVARLHGTLGVEVVLGKLFANARLLDFACSITEARQAALPPHLTAFRRTGRAQPVFFANPGGGEVGYIRGLLPGIDADIPVYGLTAIGFLAGERPLYCVQEMAAAYLDAIRHVQPHGPYRLAGWSAGGTVAYEMAHQLLAAGEAVSFIGLIDTPSPSAYSAGFTRQGRGAIPPIAVLGDLLKCEPHLLRARLHGMAVSGDSVHLDIATQVARLLPADLPPENAMRHLAVWHGMLSALGHYMPPRLPVTLTLFAAAQERKIDRTRNGWAHLVEREIHITVGGDHLSMMDPLHAKDLGGRISQALAGGPPADQVLSNAVSCAPGIEIAQDTAARTVPQPVYAAPVSAGGALAGGPGPDGCPSN
ncbi:non-ribosomal peptide synthetase [Xylophilus ampelinus]|nr:non-ribosomal peptide synthetase [Xylophilus ampelinus]MCS4509890.1 amino acid adenylation domain-containing protein [Xylophilus ampelinus]